MRPCLRPRPLFRAAAPGRAVLLALLVAAAALSLGAAAPVASAREGFAWPLPGPPELGRRFAPPASAWGAGHRGADLLAPEGSPVLAAGAGQVTYAGLLAGRGVVTVAHPDGLRTTYEPLDVLVEVGDTVEQGDLLGLLAAGHASCPLGRACLHWGLLRGSTYLDPLLLVDLGRVRLLPREATGVRHGTAAPPAGSRAAAAPAAAASGPQPRPARPAGRAPGSPGSGSPGSGSPGSGAALAAGLALTGAGALAAGRLRR